VTLVLGMDIGGTHSRARLASADGATVAEAESGSASLTAAGPERAEKAVADLLTALGLRGAAVLDPFGAAAAQQQLGSAEVHEPVKPGSPGEQRFEPLRVICVGTAGSGSPASVKWFKDRLSPLTSTSRVIVVNDSRLALPAAGLDEGIAVISGTGSTAIGVAAGREERAGGWGYLLGDEGSGYWIAREGIRLILARHDAHEDLGPIGAVLLDHSITGATEPLALLHRFHERPSPDGWARLAPLILDCSDPAADGITRDAAAALARLAAAVAERLPPSPNVVLAGGLLSNHLGLAGGTKAAVESSVPGAAVRLAIEPPVAGAVRMALDAAR
jgi:glucosamine kinase